MNHSLIIDEVLAHPQNVSWLPWAVQYFFFRRHCRLRRTVRLRSPLAQKRNGRSGESDAVNRSDLRDYRTAGADR